MSKVFSEEQEERIRQIVREERNKFALEEKSGNKKFDEFHKICEPLVKYMQDNPQEFSIHSTIIITVDGAKLVTDEMMTRYDLPKDY